MWKKKKKKKRQEKKSKKQTNKHKAIVGDCISTLWSSFMSSVSDVQTLCNGIRECFIHGLFSSFCCTPRPSNRWWERTGPGQWQSETFVLTLLVPWIPALFHPSRLLKVHAFPAALRLNSLPLSLTRVSHRKHNILISPNALNWELEAPNGRRILGKGKSDKNIKNFFLFFFLFFYQRHGTRTDLLDMTRNNSSRKNTQRHTSFWLYELCTFRKFWHCTDVR